MDNFLTNISALCYYAVCQHEENCSNVTPKNTHNLLHFISEYTSKSLIFDGQIVDVFACNALKYS